MNAFIVTLASYIWVRGLVVAISGGRSAQGLPVRCASSASRRCSAIPLIAWIADPGLRRLHLHHDQDAIRPPPDHDRRQCQSPPSAPASRSTGSSRSPSSSPARIAGLAGWLLAIRTSGATANLGIGMLFNAFAAVVIGGVSLKGGIGQLPGVYAGVLLLSSIQTAINLMGLPAHYTQMILGALVLAAVLLDTVKTLDPAEVAMTRKAWKARAPSSSARRAASARRSRERFVEEGARVVIADTEAEGAATADGSTASAAHSSQPTSRERPTPRRRCATRSSASAGSTSWSRTPASIPGR